MKSLSLFVQVIFLIYLIYTLFELASIAMLFYFDDILTFGSTTVFRTLFPVFMVSLVVGRLGNYSPPTFCVVLFWLITSCVIIATNVFSYVILNDLFVSDFFDVFAEMPLTMTSFVTYCGIIAVLVFFVVLLIKTGMGRFFPVLGGLSLTLFFITAGYGPGIFYGLVIIGTRCLSNIYSHPNLHVLGKNE
jgi:hypothetical protein